MQNNEPSEVKNDRFSVRIPMAFSIIFLFSVYKHRILYFIVLFGYLLLTYIPTTYNLPYIIYLHRCSS